MEKDKVSIIIPLYNSEKYISDSLESLLNQTYSNIEILIFNDGSTDRSKEIVESYKDNRIKFINYKKNEGYLKRLNEGIDIADGEFIARMDSDDIAHAERIETQIKFFNSNPEYSFCCTNIEVFDNNMNIQPSWMKPLNGKYLKYSLLFSNNICHPSVMIRKSLFNKFDLKYNSKYYSAEDYELWTRIAKITNLGFIENKLLNYRVHENNISITKRDVQQKLVKKIVINELAKLKLYPNDVEYFIHRNLFISKNIPAADIVEKTFRWADKLIEANNRLVVYNKEEFERFIRILMDDFQKSYFDYKQRLGFIQRKKLQLKELVKWKSLTANNPLIK